MSPARQTVDQRLVKALGHPLRQRVLIRLNEGVASPSELAEELGERLPNISYHFRILHELGAIELVGTTPRRGALEHHYRATMRPFFSDRDWATLPASTRHAVLDGVLRQVFEDVGRAASGGGFDDDRIHVTRTPLTLDERGWRELAKVLESTLEKVQRIQARSSERRAGGNGDAIEAELVMLSFHARGG